MASGRARAMEATAGFAKVIAATDDDEILGVHIIGPMAGELIAEAVLALEYSASTEDLQRTIHAHPTLSEALHEAALDADKRAIDIPESLTRVGSAGVGRLRRADEDAERHAARLPGGRGVAQDRAARCRALRARRAASRRRARSSST